MEIKYCSKCGFEIELIPQLLENDGKLPVDGGTGIWRFINRKNVIFLSVTIMMLKIFIGVLLSVLLGQRDLASIIAMLGLCLGVIGLMAAYLFLPPGSLQNRISKPKTALPNTNTQQLPPQQSIPVDGYVHPSEWKAPDTNDLAQPLSVTDNTTKLLEKDI